MTHFVYSWPETLDCTLSQTKFLTLPPQPGISKLSTPKFYAYWICSFVRVEQQSRRARSIWLGGWITSPRVWFGVGGQGVTLELAWGPSYSSLRNLHFAFAVFSIFSINIIIFSLTFYLILFFAEKLFFMFFLIRSWYFSLAFFSLSFSSICFFFYYPLLVRS